MPECQVLVAGRSGCFAASNSPRLVNENELFGCCWHLAAADKGVASVARASISFRKGAGDYGGGGDHLYLRWK